MGWPCSQRFTSLDRLSLSLFKHDTMVPLAGSATSCESWAADGIDGTLTLLGCTSAQRQLTSMCPSTWSLLTRFFGGLGDMYCRVFLHFTVVLFALELSAGFGHVVRRPSGPPQPFPLVRGADPDGPLGDHCSELGQCFLSSGLMLSWEISNSGRRLYDSVVCHSRRPELCLSPMVARSQRALVTFYFKNRCVNSVLPTFTAKK